MAYGTIENDIRTLKLLCMDAILDDKINYREDSPRLPDFLVEDLDNHISINNTCWGCIEDQPNQLAHMDPGGCLYIPNEND